MFDYDDFNRFRGITCEGHTQTDTQTDTHRLGVLYLKLFQSLGTLKTKITTTTTT